MKIELKRNEAFIHLSITEEGNLNFSHAFDMDPIEDTDLNGEELSDEAQSKLLLMSMFAGLITCAQKYSEPVIEIGQEAIACGDFDVRDQNSAELFDFMETLSEEEQELLHVTPKGEA